MDAFCAQVIALRSVVPITDAEQWQHVNSLAGMLLQISPVHKDNLRTLANSLQVAGQPREYLLSMIELLKDGGEAQWQDWTLIRNFATEHLVSFWKSPEIADAPMETLVYQVVHWVQKMGLRKPSQSTFQAITCLILIMKDGTAWTSIQKKELFDLVKMHFRRIGAIQLPGIYIANLPMPANLRHLVPDEWWMATLGAEYTACNFVSYDNLSFERVLVTIPMRNTRADVRDTQLPQRRASFGAQPGAQPADTIHGFMQTMQRFMQTMANGRGPRPALMLAAPQPLALMPPEPAVEAVQEVVADTPAPQPQPGPASVANAAGVHGGVQPMTLQDVAAVLGAAPPTPKTKPIMKRPAAAHTAVKKKPAKSAHTPKPVPGWTVARRMAAYPNGCPKCVHKPLCTPSCFRQRGEC